MEINEYGANEISNYAGKMYCARRYDEVDAEYAAKHREGGINMIREIPKDIIELEKIFEPYFVEDHLENAPKEAMNAYEKFVKWAWEQDQ